MGQIGAKIGANLTSKRQMIMIAVNSLMRVDTGLRDTKSRASHTKNNGSVGLAESIRSSRNVADNVSMSGAL